MARHPTSKQVRDSMARLEMLWRNPDALHEMKIKAAYKRWLEAEGDKPLQRMLLADLERLIKERSPEQVARMEREKGL